MLKNLKQLRRTCIFVFFPSISILCCCGSEIISFGLVFMVRISANSDAIFQLKVGGLNNKLYQIAYPWVFGWVFFSLHFEARLQN